MCGDPEYNHSGYCKICYEIKVNYTLHNKHIVEEWNGILTRAKKNNHQIILTDEKGNILETVNP